MSAFVLLFTLFSTVSCNAAGGVLDISRARAAELLKQGDISFILAAEPAKLKELSRLGPSAPFYAGILVEAAGGGGGRDGFLFEAALDSPSARVRKEAAHKLIVQITERKDKAQAERILGRLKKIKAPDGSLGTLKAAALYVLGRGGEIPRLPGAGGPSFPSWDRALLLLAEPGRDFSAGGRPVTGDALESLREFFFYPPEKGPLGRDHQAVLRWAGEELGLGNFTLNGAVEARRIGLSAGGGPPALNRLPPADEAALAGHLALSAGAYSEALALFETAVKADRPLFFRYTGLLGDLGRAYQSVPSRRETGLKVFAEWEEAARQNPRSLGPDLSGEEVKKIRYTLLFFSGRICRSQGKNSKAADFFARALAFAPDKEQEDSCIWYLISCTLNDKPENTAALIKTYAPRWNDANTFSDLLDRLSCYLAENNKWADIREVLSRIRNGNDGATIAKYAYLTGRAVSEGYLPAGGTGAGDYFNIAYEEGAASFYYRALSAYRLGKTVTPLNGTRNGKASNGDLRMAEMEFYGDFFEYGAGGYAYAYLREEFEEFSVPELRALARVFAGTGRYLESIRITGVMMRKEAYTIERADLELYYPRAFTELIETNARNNEVRVPVFFGLVRTESGFTPDIASHAGAVGLAQLMPATAKEVAASIKRRGGPDFAADGTIDLANPEINVYLGAAYLKELSDSMGSSMLALLAYNGGPGRIRRLRRQAPSLPEDMFLETIDITETRNYGKRVLAAAAAYGYLYYGMSMEQIVADIFK
ncbi:MAG: lytic transglycosylase domain-containing protein [Treponema sp.]|nr:lytic transglycosylase domain-containing protein [Treponema sp.]